MQDERYTYLLPLRGVLHAPDFAQAQLLPGFHPNQLQLQPQLGVGFEELPDGLTGRWMKQCEKVLIEHVYRNGAKEILFNRALKLYGDVGEIAFSFRQRCEEAARERRNQDALKVRVQFERRMTMLQDRVARQQRELTTERAELDARKREELLSGAEAVFNFLIGRRDLRTVSHGAQRRRQTQTAEMDVREAEQALAKLSEDLRELTSEYQAALSQINEKWMRAVGDVQEVPLAPKKSDIFADLVALAWVSVA
jgi:flagellar motility protein MotE (MotC chaperone)